MIEADTFLESSTLCIILHCGPPCIHRLNAFGHYYINSSFSRQCIEPLYDFLTITNCIIQSNLTITNPLGTTEKVHCRVFAISGFIYIEYIGVHSKVYVCYIREFIVSGVHCGEVQLYMFLYSYLAIPQTYLCNIIQTYKTVPHLILSNNSRFFTRTHTHRHTHARTHTH